MITTNELDAFDNFNLETFDYSQLDENTSTFLKQRVKNMESIANDTRYQMGRELFKAQERLAKHYKGTFYKWFQSLGLNKDDVYFWINEFKLSRNLDNAKQALNFGLASKTLKKDVMKKSAPEEAKQAVLNGDIKTHKEYKALEAKLRQRERELSDKDAQIADQQAELEDNRKTQLELNDRLAEANKHQPEPKVITKTVTKEVPINPDDYDDIKAKLAELKKQSARDKEDIDYYKRELKAAERINKNADSYDKLQEQELKRKKRQAEIDGYSTSLSINEWVPELQKLSQDDIDQMGDQAQKNLRKRLDLLQQAIDRLNSMLNGRRIIEGDYK